MISLTPTSTASLKWVLTGLVPERLADRSNGTENFARQRRVAQRLRSDLAGFTRRKMKSLIGNVEFNSDCAVFYQSG
jgi:hypothetical protein